MGLYFSELMGFLPNILAALAILIIGWLIALGISRLVGSLLRRTTLDERIAGLMTQGGGTAQPQWNVERWISGAVFWFIMLFVIMAFLQQLNLAVVFGPLNIFLNQVLGYIPGILGAVVLLFIAFLVATVLRMLVTRLLAASGLFKQISTDAQVKETNRITISQSIGNIVYWLVFLLFLPAILDALNLQGILQPVQQMVNEILSFLPNLLGAALIFVIGWLVARIVRQILTNLLSSLGVDSWLASRAGTDTAAGRFRLSDVIGTIVYVLILIPVAIAALNALNIPAVSQPAANMLNNLLLALPNIFGAILLLGIAFFVARIVGRFVAGILASLGFDNLFSWMGLRRTGGAVYPAGTGMPTGEPGASAAAQLQRTTPSQVVGNLVTIAILLFAVMEAADLLGFSFLAILVSEFITAAFQVLIGLIVFAIGLYLASLAERLIRSTGSSQASILAPAARVAIIIFSGALALRQMGIAEDIVNLAFGLLLGAVAVAAALAFGLGGREVAGRQLERWQQQMREAQARPTLPPARPQGPVTPPAPDVSGPTPPTGLD